MTKESVMSEYGDLFWGVGILPDKTKLHLLDDAIPVIIPPTCVPEALKSGLKLELQQMVKDEIITPVTEPTDWVHPIVVVKNPHGILRICLDPKQLNEAIRRPHYVTSTFAKLDGAKYFSMLNRTRVSWSVQLNKQSSYVTTFATPFGRYRYLRLPYGISSSSDIFSQKVNQIFEGINGIQTLVDFYFNMGKHPM
jgi:hypothetical protein